MKQINMNSIKNTRVRVKDIKQGRTIYIAHPVYGIEKVVLVGRPYRSRFTGNLFADKHFTTVGGVQIITSFSLVDAGISEGHGYGNGYRAFFKRKHAVAWEDKWANDPDFIKRQARHEADCAEWDDLDWDWDGE